MPTITDILKDIAALCIPILIILHVVFLIEAYKDAHRFP